MPQWAGSCWYYLRYVQPRNAERLVDPAAERYWLPVDLYVGARPALRAAPRRATPALTHAAGAVKAWCATSAMSASARLSPA